MPNWLIITIIILAVFGIVFPLTVVGLSIFFSKRDEIEEKGNALYHEAAHAVLALHHGFEFNSISVIQDSHSFGRVDIGYEVMLDNIRKYSGDDIDPQDVIKLEDLLEVFMAGYVAENILFGKPVPALTQYKGDMSSVAKLIKSNAKVLIPKGVERDTYYENMKLRAERMVEHHMGKIEHLANLLKVTPYMKAEEVIVALDAYDATQMIQAV